MRARRHSARGFSIFCDSLTIQAGSACPIGRPRVSILDECLLIVSGGMKPVEVSSVGGIDSEEAMRQVFPITPGGSAPVWFGFGMAVFLLGLTGLMLYLAWGSRHARVEVSPAGLRVVGDLYGRPVPREVLRLDDARQLDLRADREHQPVLRTNGTGLPGYLAGWFRLRNGEKALVFLTERSRVLYVPTTAGYSVVLSLENPQEVLDALRGHSPAG